MIVKNLELQRVNVKYGGVRYSNGAVKLLNNKERLQ